MAKRSKFKEKTEKLKPSSAEFKTWDLKKLKKDLEGYDIDKPYPGKAVVLDSVPSEDLEQIARSDVEKEIIDNLEKNLWDEEMRLLIGNPIGKTKLYEMFRLHADPISNFRSLTVPEFGRIRYFPNSMIYRTEALGDWPKTVVSEDGGLRYQFYEEKEHQVQAELTSDPYLVLSRKGRYDEYWVNYKEGDPVDKLKVPVAVLDQEEALKNMKKWQEAARSAANHVTKSHSNRYDPLPPSTIKFLTSVAYAGKYMTEKQARAICRTATKYVPYCGIVKDHVKTVYAAIGEEERKEPKMNAADIKKAAKDAVDEVFGYKKPMTIDDNTVHTIRVTTDKTWRDTQNINRKLDDALTILEGGGAVGPSKDEWDNLFSQVQKLSYRSDQDNMIGMAPWKVLEGRDLNRPVKVYQPDHIILDGTEMAPMFTVSRGRLYNPTVKELLKKGDPRNLILVKDFAHILEDYEQLKMFYELNKPIPRKLTRWERIKETTKASAHKATYVGAGIAGTLAALVF